MGWPVNTAGGVTMRFAQKRFCKAPPGVFWLNLS